MTATSYAEIAATRPRVRRDVLFTQTPHGVIFHNADGGFQLTAKSGYRFATLLMPYLDGSRPVEEICAGFGDAQKAMVGELVQALYARGFARPVPAPEETAAPPETPPAVAARFAPQIAYIDHYADAADTRFARYRGTRVAVLGDGPVARWCVLSLIRNGCAVVGVESALAEGGGAVTPEEFAAVHGEAAALAGEGCPVELRLLPGPDARRGPAGWPAYDGYDVVVATGPGVPGVVLPLLREGVPRGRTLLPAWTFGGSAVVGPAMTAASASCWACAALRLGAADGTSAADAAELWSGLALGTGTPGAQPTGPLAAMLGNLLGYEVFRLVTGALPAETRDRVLVQSAATFDVASEPLLAHPRCPFCASPAGRPEPVDLTSAPARPAFLPTVGTAPDDDAAQGPLAALERRSALVRPFTGVFTAYADEPLTQTPLKVGSVVLGLGARGTRTVTAFDVHHTAGARLRALDAAATVYAEHVVPAVRPVEGALDALPAVAPETLTLASGTGGSGGATAWTPATSLITKEAVRVPSGAVRPFGRDNADRRFEPTRAGAGAGSDLPAAAAAGLLSALAHDALRRAVAGAGDTARIAPEAFGEDPETTFLLRSAALLGLTVELLDLGERAHSGAGVVLARTTGAAGGGRWAVGAALDLTSAAVDAVRDLLGEAQLAGEGVVTDDGDPLLRDLVAALVPVTRAEPVRRPGEAVEWTRVLDRLAAAGRDALVVPTHAADLPTAGIHTVRVLLTRAAADES
ncbi:TOMM precursor leader peptide-binding protein [Streptomyces sp. NPDC002057]|uniref:TOMM precursor leader peptide-binding protein n=1 Tax=Streptomyces sp. NPDC002057 TaxID=3154664 RepID=UPI00332EF13A